MSDFAAVVELLEAWPDLPAGLPEVDSSVANRLLDALQGLCTGSGAVGPWDVAGLVSHLLRREALLRSDATLTLTVPRGGGWPDAAETWREFCCTPVLTTGTSFRLQPATWRPGWLEDQPAEGVLAPVLREDLRREEQPVLADPMLRETLGRGFYLGRGQRAAVRGALLMKPGASLLAVLPTGGGKSLAAFAPALLSAETGGVVLVVVPTVALALDQEKRAAALFSGMNHVSAWAYHGGLEAEEKRLLRQRIRDGRQPIVFASPEAIFGSLRATLLAATRAGALRYFVIDEAHLVSQWGDDFRPEFQALSGIRQFLLAACPPETRFRTVLLTATLTEESWWTLRTLFGGDDLEVCAALNLRPEPDFWCTQVDDADARVAPVLELARVLPRPFILYTSTREDADAWSVRLKGAGLRRVGTVHGGTNTAVRQDVILEWNDQQLDVVVATSAFGLGMDQSDVRAVVHACVPETVDRFYQEVGRGGRDGRAALSVLVHQPGDLDLARSLSSRRIIGVEKGFARWRAMHAAASDLREDDSFLVPLDARHAGVRGDTDANEAWNLRTLVLMARAGLLELQAHLPPPIEPGEGESQEAFETRFQAEYARHMRLCRVKPLSTLHLDAATWKAAVEPVRRATKSADQEAHQRVRDLLRGDVDFASIFQRVYTVEPAGIHPTRVEGNCPRSRRRGVARSVTPAPFPDDITDPVCAVGNRLTAAIQGYDPSCVLVAWPSEIVRRRGGLKRSLLPLVRRLVAEGLREVAVSDDWLEDPRYRQLFRGADPPLVLHTSPAEDIGPLPAPFSVPRLTLLGPEVTPRQLQETLSMERPIHLVLLPADAPDPDRPDRGRFLATRTHLTLAAFAGRLDQWGS